MKTYLVHRGALGETGKREMFNLLATQFNGAKYSSFEKDLDNKNWVILLRDPLIGRIAGFTTLAYYQSVLDGKPVWVVCSGDTVVDPTNWHRGSLAQVWWSCVEYLRRHYGSATLYWLLISSGYRTYRYLPVFARRFFPCYAWPTPPAMQRLMDHLAYERFGVNYHAESGVVRLENPHPLKPALSGIPEGRIADPHIAYFAQRNPGHVFGDELACLTEVEATNLTAFGRRLADRAAADEIAFEIAI
jgi:hypothetical protein